MRPGITNTPQEKPARWVDRLRPSKGWGRDLLWILLVLGGVQLWQTRHLLPTGGQTPAPSFHLNQIDGKSMVLGGPSPQARLVYFWAPWCGVCKITAANVEAVSHWVNSEQIRIETVALSYENQDEVHRYLTDHQLTISTGLGQDEVAQAYRIEAFPTFYWINRSGNVVGQTVGYTSRLGLWVRTMLAFWGEFK